MCITITKQNINKQSPSKLLGIRNAVACKLVEDFADLLIIGGIVFFVRIFYSHLSKIFAMNTALIVSIKTLYAKSITFIGEINWR